MVKGWLMAKSILIADDDAVSRRLLRKLLDQWGYIVTEVTDGRAALKALVKPLAPKLAILDWMMPGLDGPEVVQQLRQARLSSYTYVLLLTAKTGKSDTLAGLDAGADDYLTKPCDAQELRARLRVGERILELQGSLENALAASEFRASHDGLTGLYNRPTIMAFLQREINRSVREGKTTGVILADVDHFKSVNDTYGHAAGDQVLLEIAGRMHGTLRSYDFLGRYGGEEFLIVAPGCGPVETQEVAERLRQAVARVPICAEGIRLKSTISLGAGVADSSAIIGPLLQHIDSALYEAKREGRNRVAFAPMPEDHAVSASDFPLPAGNGFSAFHQSAYTHEDVIPKRP
jgi:two-component system, cell cycle response regulator